MQNLAAGADIASAATVDLTADTGNSPRITGVVATSAVTMNTAQWCLVVADGAWPLTYNATTNKISGSASYTLTAGDMVLYHKDLSGIVHGFIIKADGTAVVAFTPTAANALSGSVIQVVNTITGAVATGTTILPHDDTIPQNTEGDQYMSLAVTPGNANNKLRIDVVLNGAFSVSGYRFGVALFQDTTAGALAAVSKLYTNAGVSDTNSFTHYMTAGTTSTTTFKVRAGVNTAGTLTFNGETGARLFGCVMASSITITEIKV